ncbi:MAG: ribonuclease P protein component [Tepidisphaeraceae bacterium]
MSIREAASGEKRAPRDQSSEVRRIGTTMAAQSYTFPKSHRLGGRLRFAAVFDAKMRESRGPLNAYALPNDLGHPRLGISISRRVGTAPKRNRIKRLLRESFRLMQHDLPHGYDFVIVVRPHATLMLAEYQKLLSAMFLKLHRTWGKRNAMESSS